MAEVATAWIEEEVAQWAHGQAQGGYEAEAAASEEAEGYQVRVLLTMSKRKKWYKRRFLLQNYKYKYETTQIHISE